MREILFKAKRVFDDKWVVGYLVKGESCYIITSEDFYSAVATPTRMCTEHQLVDKNTVCQFTGLLDIDGNGIFEGDIVKVESMCVGGENIDGIYTVNYDEAAFWLEDKENQKAYLLFQECCEFKIIGNIHDEVKACE